MVYRFVLTLLLGAYSTALFVALALRVSSLYCGTLFLYVLLITGLMGRHGKPQPSRGLAPCSKR
jgi:hypothetical protein